MENHAAVPTHKNHLVLKLKRTENSVSLVTSVLPNQSSGKSSRMPQKNQRDQAPRVMFTKPLTKTEDQVLHQVEDASLYAYPTPLLNEISDRCLDDKSLFE